MHVRTDILLQQGFGDKHDGDDDDDDDDDGDDKGAILNCL